MEIYVSSITGNTRKVADAIIDHLSSRGNLPDDPVILCFWCRRGSMDDQTLRTLESLEGRRILAFGTMGHDPKDSYGDRVRRTVTEKINEKNICLGVFLCQGKIDEQRTEKRRLLPPDHRHYLDDAGYARHLASRTHPDETDLADAIAFFDDNFTMERSSIFAISFRGMPEAEQ